MTSFSFSSRSKGPNLPGPGSKRHLGTRKKTSSTYEPRSPIDNANSEERTYLEKGHAVTIVVLRNLVLSVRGRKGWRNLHPLVRRRHELSDRRSRERVRVSRNVEHRRRRKQDEEFQGLISAFKSPGMGMMKLMCPTEWSKAQSTVESMVLEAGMA